MSGFADPPCGAAAEHTERLRLRDLQAFQAAAPEHIGRLGWDRRRIAAHQVARLRTLLAHARAHSPFHARRLAGVDVARCTQDDLRSLPIMGKAEMMAQFDDVVTDRRLTRQLVDAHLDGIGEFPHYLLDEYVVLASGGSSGERGVFVYRRDELVEFALGVLRAPLAALLAAGAPAGTPLALVAAGSAIHATGAITAVFGHGGAVEVTSVPATLPLAEIVRRLNDLQPVLLTGYPSLLARLAGEQRAGRLHITPQSVTSTSETLTPSARREIGATFEVPVVDCFGSTEGLVGVSAPGDDAIVFASDLAIVELVDEQYRPVGAGTRAARVLVTNLYNLTQPLIRYELTDRFRAHSGTDEHGHLRASVDGRADGVFKYPAGALHPLVIRSALAHIPEVREYQVRQTADGIEVDIVCPAAAAESICRGLEQRLAAALERAGLAGLRATVRAVSDVPRHPQTGKARRFIPCGTARTG